MKISNLMVLESAAGFYIGRTCESGKDSFPMPYSRESGYYKTKEEAAKALVTGFIRRVASENEYIYEYKRHEYAEVSPGLFKSIIHFKLKSAAL